MMRFDFAQALARVRNLLNFGVSLDNVHALLVRDGATPEEAHWIIRAAQYQNGTLDT